MLALQVKTDYQHAVKEGIVDLGFQNPSKAAQLAAHHIDQVKVVHPIPEQGCINLDNACKRKGHVVSGEQVCAQAFGVWCRYTLPVALQYCCTGVVFI